MNISLIILNNTVAWNQHYTNCFEQLSKVVAVSVYLKYVSSNFHVG